MAMSAMAVTPTRTSETVWSKRNLASAFCCRTQQIRLLLAHAEQHALRIWFIVSLPRRSVPRPPSRGIGFG
jgi:hypothetical protein